LPEAKKNPKFREREFFAPRITCDFQFPFLPFIQAA
jgi:hypothetical protein